MSQDLQPDELVIPEHWPLWRKALMFLYQLAWIVVPGLFFWWSA